MSSRELGEWVAHFNLKREESEQGEHPEAVSEQARNVFSRFKRAN